MVMMVNGKGGGATKNRWDRNIDLRLMPCFRRIGQMWTGYGFVGDCFATNAQSRYKF